MTPLGFPTNAKNAESIATLEVKVPRVTRSAVPPGKGYKDYLPYLREDFWFSCGYCSITEAEATAIRFVIDHYEPRTARKDLEHEYSNLMYACDPCNARKGDRCPPPEARAKGLRFFKADEDEFAQHFGLSGIRIESKTHTGEYTIQALDLNRQTLRRLREIRARLAACDKYVSEGIVGLRRFPMDRLPAQMRGRLLSFINDIARARDEAVKSLDEVLKENARSPLDSEDVDAPDRAKQRDAVLKAWEAMFPGVWRGRDV